MHVEGRRPRSARCFETQARRYEKGSAVSHCRLSKFGTSQGFSESMSKFYAAGLIESLRFLHKNDIVYRDIKPENILIGNVRPKISSSGLKRPKMTFIK